MGIFDAVIYNLVYYYDDSLIRKSKIISSDQLSTGRLQQKTEQINLEFSEDSRDNDIREGTFHI